MPTIIVLESERLVFRQHEPADLDPYCAMEMDPEVRPMWVAIRGPGKMRNADFAMARCGQPPAGSVRVLQKFGFNLAVREEGARTFLKFAIGNPALKDF